MHLTYGDRFAVTLSTSSTGMPHILAARSLSTWIASRAAKMVAIPEEGAATAFRSIVMTEGSGVTDVGFNVVVRDAKFFRCNHCHG